MRPPNFLVMDTVLSKIPITENHPPNFAPEIEQMLVETIDPEGPFGAKGVSEGYQVPGAPAIANAIYHATGIRIKEVPVNPEEILKGLEGLRGSHGKRNKADGK